MVIFSRWNQLVPDCTYIQESLFKLITNTVSLENIKQICISELTVTSLLISFQTSVILNNIFLKNINIEKQSFIKNNCISVLSLFFCRQYECFSIIKIYSFLKSYQQREFSWMDTTSFSNQCVVVCVCPQKITFRLC